MTSDRSATSADLPLIVGSPSSAPVVRVRDVIVCPTSEIDPHFSVEDLRANPPVGFRLGQADISAESVSLGNGVTVDRLSQREAERVMNACSPRGHHFVPVRQFAQRYSFIRELDPQRVAQTRSQWDSDGVLYDCLALSRLVRDNAFSSQYAARIFDFEDGEQQIIPAVGSASTAIYRLRSNRDWLDPTEAAQLADLLTAYWEHRDVLPARLSRAIWRAEWSCSISWADVALPVIVSGLEALLKTERHSATRQFVERVPLLARELGVDQVSAELCEDAYDGRSAWIHGAHVRLFVAGSGDDEGALASDQREALLNVAVFQTLLRASVRSAVEDAAVRDIFRSDDSVRSHWPIPT